MPSGTDVGVTLNQGTGGAVVRVRQITGLTEGTADQQVITLADSQGNLFDLVPVTGSVGTAPVSTVNVGQTAIATAGTAMQLSSTSMVSTNGILVQGLSTNSYSVFVGGSSVTTSNGFELQAGQAVPFTVSNITALYVVGTHAGDGVCFNVL